MNVAKRMFDLKALLTRGDLDIRGVAAKNESLSAAEYFNRVSLFLGKAPEYAVNIVMEALERESNLNGGEASAKSLAEAETLLSEIGFKKPVSSISNMLDHLKKGDRKSAANCANGTVAEIKALSARISAAVIDKPPYTVVGRTLKSIIDELDYDEDNRKLRILAVDDASFMLQTIKSALKDNYEVFLLKNPALVKGFLANTTPELFLLDYTMPDINGAELASIIRSFEKHKNTPIIFLTAMGSPNYIAEALSAGACDYVLKPLNAEILRERITKHIVRKRDF